MLAHLVSQLLQAQMFMCLYCTEIFLTVVGLEVVFLAVLHVDAVTYS